MARILKSTLFSVLILLLFSSNCFAVGKKYNSRSGVQDFCINFKTEDGTVDNKRCRDVKVSDGSFTDNGGDLSLKTGASVENISTTPKTDDYTVLTADENLVFNTSSRAITVTMLSSPVDGKKLAVILETDGNDLTVSGNGKNILGDSSLVMNNSGEGIQMIYNGIQWNLK